MKILKGLLSLLPALSIRPKTQRIQKGQSEGFSALTDWARSQAPTPTCSTIRLGENRHQRVSWLVLNEIRKGLEVLCCKRWCPSKPNAHALSREMG
jgi:hypothetical protein